ncbi:sensor histidine kinase [Streptomyces sp. NPDC004111]|uniref:sensor histidine kinase n=1 Tax=Streptomyces sp. NPDC004111 TaxID=3364690 RepID=UPI0036B4880E
MKSERRRRLYDLGVWLAVSAPPVAVAATHQGQGRAVLMAVVGVPLLALAVALGRRWPLGVLLVPLALQLAQDAELLALPFLPALTVLAFVAGGRAGEVRPAVRFFGAAALAGLPVCVFVRDLWAWPTQLLMLLLTVGLPWLLGRWRRQYADLVSTGWRLADRMERERQAVADRTRMRERARIAGDMHDSLGHDLTLIALRAAALQVDPGLDARQRAAVGELREAAAAATGRLRETIGVLRADDEGYSGDERPSVGEAGAPVAPAEVVERARAAGVDAALEQRGDLQGLPPMVGHALHRVVQEAVTNATKHAPGAAVRVEVVRDGDTLDVRVTNGAPTAGGPGGRAGRGTSALGVASGGTGLVGLDERVRLAGGTLRAGPLPGDGGGGGEGWYEVVARLPAVAGAAAGEERPVASESARELEHARDQVRLRVRQTVVAPLAALAGILLVLFPVSLANSALSVLDRESYERPAVGEPRGEVAEGMPLFTRDGVPDGAPAEPPGEDCVYYSTRLLSDDAYRLCFSGGKLASKGTVGG